MSIIDIIIIVPFAVGAISGFRKGFIVEVATLLALILAVIGGFHFLHWGIALLQDQFNLSGNFVPLLSFILIFIGIVLIVNLVGKVLKKLVDMVFLGALDKIAGALLGGLKFVFFLSLLIWAFTVFGIELPEPSREESLLYPYIVAIAPSTVEMFGFIIPATSNLLDKISELINFAGPAQ